jgi:5-methyltetrahydrofolate--homocysteine methyltransferase
VFRLLDCPSIGLSLSGGYALEPEQSTLAIVAHHPQAIYFGMRAGHIPESKSPDELIAGTERGGALPPEEEPEEAPEESPAMTSRAAATRG